MELESKSFNGISLPNLRSSLNKWDPIQILDSLPNPPIDEYDALLMPIARLLSAPHAKENLTSFLREEMVESFGLDPDLVGVDEFVEKLLTQSRAWIAETD